MRGHGTTTFRSPRTPRDGEQVAMALDVVALMDALRIEKATLVGYDLGSRSADIIAALWPQRVRALLSTTGYLITNPAANLDPAAPALEWAFRYQYYDYVAIIIDNYRWRHNVPQEDPAGFAAAVVQAGHL
jgi:pimeloyl-ACP methyl ester carboxylesterase